MTEPITTVTTAAATASNINAVSYALTATTVAAAGWASGMDAGTVIGAFTGAVFFVVSAQEYSRWSRAFFFIVSFLSGISCAHWTAAVATEITRRVFTLELIAPDGMGAILSSSVAVNFLQMTKDKALLQRVANAILARLRAAAKAALGSLNDKGGPDA